MDNKVLLNYANVIFFYAEICNNLNESKFPPTSIFCAQSTKMKLSLKKLRKKSSERNAICLKLGTNSATQSVICVSAPLTCYIFSILKRKFICQTTYDWMILLTYCWNFIVSRLKGFSSRLCSYFPILWRK